MKNLLGIARYLTATLDVQRYRRYHLTDCVCSLNWNLLVRSRFARNLTNLFKSHKSFLQQLHFVNDAALWVAVIPF